MKPVVIAGFIGTTNLLLERDSHGFSLSNFKGFHALMLSTPPLRGNPLYCITYDAVFSSTIAVHTFFQTSLGKEVLLRRTAVYNFHSRYSELRSRETAVDQTVGGRSFCRIFVGELSVAGRGYLSGCSSRTRGVKWMIGFFARRPALNGAIPLELTLSGSVD